MTDSTQSQDDAPIRITTSRHSWHRIAINGHSTEHHGYVVSVQNVVSEEVWLFSSSGNTRDTALQYYKRIYPNCGLPDAIVSEEPTSVMANLVEHLRRFTNTDQKIWPVLLLKSDGLSAEARDRIQDHFGRLSGAHRLYAVEERFNQIVQRQQPFTIPSLSWDKEDSSYYYWRPIIEEQIKETESLIAAGKASRAWRDRMEALIEDYETYKPYFSPFYMSKTMRHAQEIKHNVKLALSREEREFEICEQRLQLLRQLKLAQSKQVVHMPKSMRSRFRRKLGREHEEPRTKEQLARVEEGALQEATLWIQLGELHSQMRLGRSQEEPQTSKFLDQLEKPELERLDMLEKRYQYRKLSSPMQFRLLRLHAKNDHKDASALRPLMGEREFGGWERQSAFFDALVCSLETFDLDDPDCPLFEALSYEWNTGQRREGRLIVIREGGEVKGSLGIGANLFDFLMHIRQDDDDCWLWADAICINQKSLEERNSQVKLMGRIYRQAFKALAWLPVEEPSSCAAALRYLHHSTREKLMQEGYLQTHQTELERLFGLSYWSRKWIIQEVLLARTVVLVLGQPEFPMQDLEDIFAKLETAQMLDFSSRPVARLASHRRKRRLRETYPQTLSELLSLYQHNECGERFDHVYALYNLIGEHRSYLEVNYDQHPSTWIEAILKFLSQHEQRAREMLIHSAAILERLVGKPDVLRSLLPSRGPTTFYTADAYDHGDLEQCEECGESVRLREHVQRLHPGSKWTWNSRGSPPSWYLYDKSTVDKLERLNTRVMGYFRIPSQKISGLASVRIQPGDRVWQFMNTDFAFIVRLDEPSVTDVEPQIRILGRCYLFKTGDEDFVNEPSYATLTAERLLVGKNKALESHELRLTISDLFELARSASMPGFSEPSISHVRSIDDDERPDGSFRAANTAESLGNKEPVIGSKNTERSTGKRAVTRNRPIHVRFAPSLLSVDEYLGGTGVMERKVTKHEVSEADAPESSGHESSITS